MHKRLLSSAALVGTLLATACEAPPTTPPARGVVETAAGLTVSNCRVLPTSQALASGDDGNGPANTLDDNLATRWSNLGKGSSLTLDLGTSQPLAGAAVAWHLGNTRQNHFTLSTSTDGTTFTPAYAADSALTASAQTYRFTRPLEARYLRITVNGNTLNDWASIAEARVCGDDTPTPAPPPNVPTTDSGPALPRQPYLQSVGTTRALVAFRTGVSCTPFVRFGEGSDISRTATATAAGWRHAVTLDGLRPGRTYSYVVEACGSVTGVRQFQTATGPETPRVHFTAMGDFGTGGSLQASVLELLSQPGRAGELVLGLGDTAYESGTEQEFQDHLFKPMEALLRKVPLYPTLGNHEYETSQGQPYLDNFYLPANNPAKTERYYSFEWGPVHFVGLDSQCALGWVEANSCTLAAQKSWLAQDLAATRQPWKVVFFHHPFWSTGEHGSYPKMRGDFAPLFEQYGVDLVLTGHDHDYERSRSMKGDAVAPSGTRGITYFVVGSGGANIKGFAAAQPAWSAFRDSTNAGYLDVVVDGGTMTAKFIIPSGSVRDSVTLSKTLPAAAPQPSGVSAVSLETPPGPMDDPARQPAFLSPRAPLPPADTPEAVADKPEPSNT